MVSAPVSPSPRSSSRATPPSSQNLGSPANIFERLTTTLDPTRRTAAEHSLATTEHSPATTQRPATATEHPAATKRITRRLVPAHQLFRCTRPLGFAGGDYNLTRYVSNSPVNGTDPEGLSWWDSVSSWFASWFVTPEDVAAATYFTQDHALVEGHVNRSRLESLANDAAISGIMDPNVDPVASARPRVSDDAINCMETVVITAAGSYGMASGWAGRSTLQRLANRSRVVFEGMEVRAVRELSHLDDTTLRAMKEHGFAATDVNGNSLQLHHHNQSPAGPLVEIPAPKHNINHPVQHPQGNQPGVGLTDQQRGAFNEWRVRYWRARAEEELNRRCK